MTTICADPATGIMATDSNVTDGNQKWKEPKVERIDGVLYAACGDEVEAQLFYEWIRKGRRGRKPKLDEEGFNALALGKQGLVWFDNKLHPVRMKHPFAIGSGAQAARAAIFVGASVERAIEAACEVDPGSALPVQVYRVEAGK